MGISSFTYNSTTKGGDKKNTVMEKMIKSEKEIQEHQIIKNIKQQICQVDKNLFQEYNLLNTDNFEESLKNIEEKNKSKIKGKNDIIEEIFDYYRTPAFIKGRNNSANLKENKYLNETLFILDEENLEKFNERFNTLENKQVSILLKMFKLKHLARRKAGLIKKETKRLYKFNQIKSLDEIKKQKEKQLELFLHFDTKKYRKKNKNNKEYNENISIEESSNKSENSSFDISFEDNRNYHKNKSQSDSEKWDKNKILINSIFFSKKSEEFLDINNTPYFFITTPFPKLRDFSSTKRINKNPLDILRKMDIEYFLSLGNFKEKDFNKGKNIFNSNNLKFYSDDNFTSIPYEILDFNETNDLDINKKKNIFKNVYNNIITSTQKNENKKKYIVFVLNDFYDTYVKYKNIFKYIITVLNGRNNKNKKYIKKFSKLKINDNNDLLLNTKTQTRPTNNPYKRSMFTHKTEKFDKMPNIFSTNNNINNINNINKKEKQNNRVKKEQISELKFVLFNLPGQSTTLFTKKNNQNNIYYTDFLDRFIYFLYKEKEFDLSYKIILLGFGNGGHIALTYASLYEKYWNILDSVILFNAYCRNCTIINEAMLEILKTVTREKNPKKVEAFVKQNMRNPKEFNMNETKEKKRNKNNNILNSNLNSNYKRKESKSLHKLTYRIQNYYDNNKQNDDDNEENIVNNMTLDGYKLITKGYFYNIPINLKEINTKILCVHSNVDSFINIHNISPLFGNDIPSYRVTPLKKFSINGNNNLSDVNTVMGYELNNFRNDENAKRKLIIFDGSHDITYNSNEKDNIICKALISYFK